VSARPRLIHRVIARLNVGGPAMQVVHLARAFNEGRWRTRLVTGSIAATEGDMVYYAEERGVALTLLPEMSRDISVLGDVRTLLALVRLFRRERPDIVHTHTAKAGTLGRLAAFLAGVPVRIHTYHGHVLGGDYFGPLATRVFLEIERQLARITDRLVVLTERQATEMADELRVAPRDKFVVVPLGLELDRFAAVDRAVVRARTREGLGIEPHATVVGMVGRMVPVKNHELFLEAMAELIGEADGPVRGLIVGSGGREAELRERAAALGLDGRLIWLGWRRDLPELYPAMDVVALTSHDEGTPVALLEALAAGTQIVARDVGGVGEVLEGGRLGTLLARSAGPREWASSLAAAARRPSWAAEDRFRIAGRYSVGRLVADLAALYDGALPPPSELPPPAPARAPTETTWTDPTISRESGEDSSRPPGP
jgi:glycosyltransferase involved in cell wall biosynthesis